MTQRFASFSGITTDSICIRRVNNKTTCKMPTYKLSYFDLRAKAEPTRYMFELAGVTYEDVRVSPEQWKELKPKIGLGQMPVLEVDGKELPQSGAINRYIGRNYGFYPSDAWEAAQVDVVIETINEFDPETAKLYSKQQEAIDKFKAEILPKKLGILEKLLRKNKDGKGWFVGDKISVADVMVFSMLHDLVPAMIGLEVGGLDLTAYPALSAFIGRFKAEKKISEWIEKRPVTSI